MSDIDEGEDIQFDNGQEYGSMDEEQGEEIENTIHQENHIDYYRNETDDEMEMSFEKDYDRLIKVKAKIMFNLNKERQFQEMAPFYQDITLSSIAMQYAASLKSTGIADYAYFERLRIQQWIDNIEIKNCEITSNYQEDIKISKQYTQKFFIETGYLFLQMDREREILMDTNNTHIGIGIAGNQTTIALVLLVTQRDLTITSIEEPTENHVEIRGKMIDTTTGICGVKIYNNEHNVINFILFDMIDFNRTTKQFICYIDIQTNWKQRRWVQLLVRQNPGGINYRKPRKDKDKERNYQRHLKPKLKSNFILYPDQHYIQCYNQQLQAQQTNTLIDNLVLDSVPIQTQEKEVEPEEEEQPPVEQQEDEEDEAQQKPQVNKEQMTSNKEIKQQLQMAIGQAKNTYESLQDQNKIVQAKIKEIRDKNNIHLDKTAQTSMNEHKYFNILAQFHQTRVQLQQSQDKYNRMSLQLQQKLKQKQTKCNDIRVAFKDLKRQIAKKATYSRSDQPIKPSKIEEWEDREAKITEELQELRLQILRARNSLVKNQKILKKKEELAQGLHLIDFEQLKIQNQTLNERIQERNEDLHKLKKKATTMVQILTHTRQKLVFVEKMKSNLAKNASKLDETIQGMRAQINLTKQNCQKLREEIQKAKQETSIVNSQELVVDFKRLGQSIKKLEQQIEDMLVKEKEMKNVIEMYQRKLKKQALNG